MAAMELLLRAPACSWVEPWDGTLARLAVGYRWHAVQLLTAAAAAPSAHLLASVPVAAAAAAGPLEMIDILLTRVLPEMLLLL